MEIPNWVENDFDLFKENVLSLQDNEDPKALYVYRENVISQLHIDMVAKLNQFHSMADQVAMCLINVIGFAPDFFDTVDLSERPDFEVLRKKIKFDRSQEVLVKKLKCMYLDEFVTAIVIIFLFNRDLQTDEA